MILTCNVNVTFCRSQSYDFTGLKPSGDKEFIVFFHVLIPKNVWGLVGDQLSVHLRFGHDKMGKWNDVGEFNLIQ